MKFFKTLTLLILTYASGYAQCDTRSSYEMDSTWESFSYDLSRLDSIYLSKKSIIDSLNGPDLLSKTNNNQLSGGFLSPIYWVPIKVFIVESSTNPDGANITEAEVEYLIRRVNDLFKGGQRTAFEDGAANGRFISHPDNAQNPVSSATGIQFYLLGIERRQDDVIYDLTDDEKYESLNGYDFYDFTQKPGNYRKNAINIYFLDQIEGKDGGFANGFANKPTWYFYTEYEFKTAIRVGGDNPRPLWAIASTISHEIGHLLNLDHTHDAVWPKDHNGESVACKQEKVSRTAMTCTSGKLTCARYGDKLCDTPGDARVPTGVGFDGVYTGSEMDKDGVVWDLAAFNVMSYHLPNLGRVQFTGQQMALMYEVLDDQSKGNYPMIGYAENIDVYEPDGVPVQWVELLPNRAGSRVEFAFNREKFFENKPLRNRLQFEDPQLRGHHKNPERIGTNHPYPVVYDVYTADEDWAWFEIETRGIYTLGVRGHDQNQDIDTRIGIYDETGALLIQKNTLNDYEEFTDTILDPGLYWIKVDQELPMSSGRYELFLNSCGTTCCYGDYIEDNNITAITNDYNFLSEAFNVNVEYYLGSNLTVSAVFGLGYTPYTHFDNTNFIAGRQNFNYRVCNSAFLAIQNGGEFNIGGDRQVNCRFSENTKLILDGGSQLKIASGSTLVIEAGAEFEINGNVQVIVEQGAELIIEGKLRINGSYKLTHNTNGVIVFNQNIPIVNGSYDLGSFYEYDSDSEIEVIGDPQNGIRPEVRILKPLYLKGLGGTYPSSITMEHCDVHLASGAFLYSFSETTVDNVEFNSLDGTTPNGHLGLRVYGNPGLNIIRNSVFKNGNVGVHAQWLGNHAALRILDNTFSTTTGLKLESGKFEVSRNVFNSNSRIECIGLQGVTKFNHNDLDGGGLYLHGSNNTFATLDYNVFRNGQTSLVVEQMTADLNCNEFTGNVKAIEIFGSGAVVADDNASNYFFNNTISINFSDPNSGSSASLFLKDGNNEFLLGPGQQNKLHINGVFDFVEDVPNSLFTSTYAANGDLDVDNNYFEYSTTTCLPGMPCPPSGYYSVMPVSIKVYENRGMPNQNLVADIQLDISNNAADINAICDNGIIGGAEFPVLNYIQGISSPTLGGVVNTYGKNLKTLLVTQAQNISFGNFVASDLQTLDTLQTILESGITGGDVSTAELLDITYELMLTALENCYTLGHLTYTPSNITGPLHTELSRSIALIDSQLVVLDPADSSDTPLIFKFNLDKAMSYRNGAFYSQALAQLASRSSWSFSTTDVNRSNYWDCIIRAEHDVLTGTIDEEEYTLVRSGCEATYSGFTYKDNSGKELDPGYLYNSFTKEEVKFNVYPNPAVDKFNLDIAFSYDEIILSSQSGVMVREYKFENGHSYPLEGLAPGVYIISVKGVNNKEYRSLLIIE